MLKVKGCELVRTWSGKISECFNGGGYCCKGEVIKVMIQWVERVDASDDSSGGGVLGIRNN